MKGDLVASSVPERRLPVWAVVRRSYVYVWERRRLLAVPLLLVFGVQLLSALYVEQSGLTANAALPGSKALAALISLGVTLFSMSIVVGIHRTVLADEIRPGFAFMRWDSNLLRYVGTWLLLAAVGALLFIIFVLILAIAAGASGLMGSEASRGSLVALGSVIAAMILFVVFLRFMLALPAAALGVEDRLGVSWRATDHNWLRLFAVAFLTVLPFIVLNVAIALPAIRQVQTAMSAGAEPAAVHLSIPILLVSAAIKAIDLAVLTVMLSLSYDVLVRGGGPRAAD